MARTKKIGLKSAPSASQPIALDTTGKTTVPARCFDTMTDKKICRGDTTIETEPSVPQTGKFNAHSDIEIMLILSLAIESARPSKEMSNMSRQTNLLDLPLEIRTMIYNYVLAVDENTYEIDHAHYTTQSEWQRRHNVHRVTNIDPNHLALSTVNRQISNEIKANITAPCFRFASVSALDNFLFCEEHDDQNDDANDHPDENLRLNMTYLNILYKASKVEVIVGQRPFSRSTRAQFVLVYEMLSNLLPKPLTLQLITAESGDESLELVIEGNARR